MDTASENAEQPGSTEAGGATPTEAGSSTPAESSSGADDQQTTVGPGDTVTDPETAFSRLGNETRLRTIRTLAAEGPQTFTARFEESDADTTAGFAYHLRQITGHYVEKHGEDDEDAHYHLTSAGRAVARALDAGVYTDRVERGPEEVDGECPLCGANSLSAGLADNRVSVACTDCGTALLALPFPPGGARDGDSRSSPTASVRTVPGRSGARSRAQTHPTTRLRRNDPSSPPTATPARSASVRQ